MNDDEEFAAFVQDETESTYRFLWNGIKAALILLGALIVAGALTILIWKANQ